MKNFKTIIIFTVSLLLLLGISGMAAEKEVIVSPQNELENTDISSFGQAPKLAEKVETGELPPVAERLPEEPYVVKDKEVGRYGGTLNEISLRPSVTFIDGRAIDLNSFLKPSVKGGKVLLNFAKKVEISADKSDYTIHLREGVKWSDGEPFTTEDIKFWYEDFLHNKELTPVIGQTWKSGGEVVDLEIIDDYTFRFDFSQPKPFFKMRLAHMHAAAPMVPKHYLKQFHPDYVDKEELVEEAKSNGFDHWYQYFQDRATRAWNSQIPGQPDLPTLGAYTLVEKKSDRHTFKRNPYFWKVDKEGNQLPYLERIVCDIAGERSVVQGKIMSGALDFEGAATDIRNYPMYKNYEEKGGYNTYLWNSGMGSEVVYMVNQTNKDPVLREIFQNVKFRRALSLAINREEISETIYFGKAEPRQYTALSSSRYFKPEFENAYTEFNLEKAKTLLKEIGLKDTDGDGWRERPDGEDLTFTIEYYDFETPKTPNVELVASFWKDIGIKAELKTVSSQLQEQRAPANMMDATLWHGDKATDILFPVDNNLVLPAAPSWGASIWPAWGRWFSTDGDSGEEPPAQVKQVRSWFEQMLQEPDSQKRIQLAQNILEAQAENLWVIGTVGAAPWPVIVDKDLHNVPESGLWVWDTHWSRSRNPSTFYFDEDEGKPGNK